MNYQILANLESWLAQQIVGQHDLIPKLMLALLADGHLLVEGAPGLAKKLWLPAPTRNAAA